jgi:hypothetical protein
MSRVTGGSATSPTQGTSPWVTNITQVGSSNVPTLGLTKAIASQIVDLNGSQINSLPGMLDVNLKPVSQFVTHNGPSFNLKGQKFKFIGINYYPLIQGGSLVTARQLLDDAKAKGISVIRTWCFDPPGGFRSLYYDPIENLITNPSVETNLTGFTAQDGTALNGAVWTRSSEDAQDGTYSVKQVSGFGTYDGLCWRVNVSANTDYVWTFWHKIQAIAGDGSHFTPVSWVGDLSGTSGREILDGGIIGDDNGIWTKRQLSFNSGANTTIQLNILNFGGQNTSYFDNFNLSRKSGRPHLEYSERSLYNIDMVLDEARKRDIKIILSLADGNENNYNTKGQYVSWANSIYGTTYSNVFPYYDFWTSTYCKNFHKDLIKTLASRVNTINGRTYRDDPTIFSYELGNELRANSYGTNDNTTSSSVLTTISKPSGWIDEMSTYAKSVDANHLVGFGDSSHSYQYLQDGSGVGDVVYNGTYYGVDYGIISALPNIDYLDVHLYPDHDDGVHLSDGGGKYWGQAFGYNTGVSGDGLRAQLKDYVTVGHANNKPVIISEVGFVVGTTGDNTYYPLYNRYKAYKAILTDFLDVAGGDGVIPWHAAPAATSSSFDIALEATGGAGVTDNSNDTDIVNLFSTYNTSFLSDVTPSQTVSGLIKTSGNTVTKLINPGDATISVQLSDTWTGTVQFESTIDGITWYPQNLTDSSGNTVTSATAIGLFTGSITGKNKFRVRASAAITGTLTTIIQSASPVSLVSNQTANITKVGGSSLALGQTIMANSLPVTLASNQSIITIQGGAADSTPNAGNPLRIAVTDGTNTYNVKSINTAFDAWGADIGILSGAFGYLYNGSNWDRVRGDTSGMYVQSRAAATGGYTPGKLISAASTNATSVKGSAGTLGFVSIQNLNAAARYVKFYNKASAPTVGSDTPLLVLMVPGNTAGAGNNPMIPTQGLAFSTGIAFATTTGITDADTGAVGVNEIVINYGYK